jgi:hypothetical protein
MKTRRRILLGFLFLLPVCSFHPAPLQAPWAEPYPWVVILYFGVDNVQFGAFPTDLWGLTENLLAGGSSLLKPKIPVVMLYDGTKTGDSKIIELSARSVLDDRGEVIPPDSHEVNYGDPDTMARFILWTARHYPARHYLLGLCHHYGWVGYNTDERSPGPRGMDILTVAEHGRAMDRVKAAGVRMDVIWFEACSITMLESLYRYARDADYVVGNEDTIDFYELVTRAVRMIRWLSRNPQATPREVAERLVNTVPLFTPALISNQWTPQSYALNPRSPGHGQRELLKPRLWLPTQFAFSGPAVLKTAPALDRLALALLEALPEAKDAILAARRQTREYTLSPEYVDLVDLCAQLERRLPGAGVQSACREVEPAVRQSIAAEKKLSRDHRHHGILILFPRSPEQYQEAIVNPFDPSDHYSDLALSRDTHWDEFLSELFSR